MTHQYKKLPVTMKMWMQFNVMPWTSLGVDTKRKEGRVQGAVQTTGRINVCNSVIIDNIPMMTRGRVATYSLI